MADHLKNIWERIMNSDAIDESEKKVFLQDLSALRAQQNELDFKLKRLHKDKSIAVNILEATIQDLERKKQEVEEINEKLSAQQRELQTQKQIIEDNARVLRKNLDKLALSYKELEQFSYIASHDLKSPLRTIASFAQLLKRRYNSRLDLEAQEFIDFIVSGVHHMHEVIEGLLQYSQVGHSDELLQIIDLNEVLVVVRRNLQTDMDENEVSLTTDPLPRVYGNRVSIIQLFQNLIHNAIKFRGEQPPDIRLSCKYLGRNRQWEFRLADNGIGMSEEFQDKVFQPFQRLSAKKIAGVGIGLAICQKVVKLHYGQIRFESKPGKGTTFIFTLSAMEQTQGQEVAPLSVVDQS